MKEKLLVTNIQRFCMQDGPGIRTTVFLKGCPLRCAWCHNPETQSMQNEILYVHRLCIGCGACVQACPMGAHGFQESGGHRFDRSRCNGCGRCTKICPTKALEPAAHNMSTAEVLTEVERDRAFYGAEGGMTLSGGEPLLHGDRALALLEAAHSSGIHTAVETCGYFTAELPVLERLAECTDLFLWDYKDSEPVRHLHFTGRPPDLILQNLHKLNSLGAVIRLRCILLKGLNLTSNHAAAIVQLFESLNHCQGVDLLPYHAYGGSKKIQLGLPDNSRPDWIPSAEELESFRRNLELRGVPVRVIGD